MATQQLTAIQMTKQEINEILDDIISQVVRNQTNADIMEPTEDIMLELDMSVPLKRCRERSDSMDTESPDTPKRLCTRTPVNSPTLSDGLETSLYDSIAWYESNVVQILDDDFVPH